MPPQLIDPYDKYLMPHTTFHEAIIDHIRLLLKKFLADPAYSKFYVGITQDVHRRLQAHQRRKPEYKWMIPIYEETGVPHTEGFEQIEQLAIMAFGPAHGTKFTNPNAPGRELIFDNRRENSPPQTTLYLLVG